MEMFCIWGWFLVGITGSQLSHVKCGCCYCSITKLCLTLRNPMDCGMPGFPVLHYLSEFAQTHVH